MRAMARLGSESHLHAVREVREAVTGAMEIAVPVLEVPGLTGLNTAEGLEALALRDESGSAHDATDGVGHGATEAVDADRVLDGNDADAVAVDRRLLAGAHEEERELVRRAVGHFETQVVRRHTAGAARSEDRALVEGQALWVVGVATAAVLVPVVAGGTRRAGAVLRRGWGQLEEVSGA